VTNNAGANGTWASIAWIPSNPLNTTVPYQITLRLRAVGGAKKMGVTFVMTGENPDPDNSNLKNTQVIDLTGQDQTVTLKLPTTPANSTVALQQIALHFGYQFGSDTLGNPQGSGIVFENISVAQVGLTSSVVTAPVVAHVIPSDPGALSNVPSANVPNPAAGSGLEAVPPSSDPELSSTVMSPNRAPNSYIPIVSADGSIDPVAYQRYNDSKQLTTNAAGMASSSPLDAQMALQKAGTLDHPVQN
jgi:hypothetical protein